MRQPELRVRYDSPATVHEMLDWLVDSDPIELRDVAQNLLADVETLKAALFAAERRGREAAIADLRDHNRRIAWLTENRIWDPRASDYARYLEAQTNRWRAATNGVVGDRRRGVAPSTPTMRRRRRPGRGRGGAVREQPGRAAR